MGTARALQLLELNQQVVLFTVFYKVLCIFEYFDKRHIAHDRLLYGEPKQPPSCGASLQAAVASFLTGSLLLVSLPFICHKLSLIFVGHATLNSCLGLLRHFLAIAVTLQKVFSM